MPLYVAATHVEWLAGGGGCSRCCLEQTLGTSLIDLQFVVEIGMGKQLHGTKTDGEAHLTNGDPILRRAAPDQHPPRLRKTNLKQLPPLPSDGPVWFRRSRQTVRRHVALA
uniref:Uncharacterized protein n=1 Tax=Ralstonia solanacearum TaxID=305 RepID=A0A0S4WZL5_RALSL|nr:protein of unknown function [Ralstonia solanacearum]